MTDCKLTSDVDALAIELESDCEKALAVCGDLCDDLGCTDGGRLDNRGCSVRTEITLEYLERMRETLLRLRERLGREFSQIGREARHD